jgi:hypothetical protein
MNRLITKATLEGTLNYTYDAAGKRCLHVFVECQRRLGQLSV